MHTSILLTIWAYVAYLLYKLVSGVLVNRRAAIKARQLGCAEPPKQPIRGPFGINHLRRAIAAAKDKVLPQFNLIRHAEAGAPTYTSAVLGDKNIVTYDPKNIQALLATQFSDFGLGSRRHDNFWPLLGNGIFTQDGAAWEHSRALLRPQFVRDQVSDLELEERHVQNMMQAIAVKSDGWTDEIDIQTPFFRLTLDSATEFLFGESVESQTQAFRDAGTVTQNEKVFASAFDYSQDFLAYRSRYQNLYFLISSRKFRTSCKQVHDFVDYFVDLALNESPMEKDVEEQGEKQKYVFLRALAAETRDPVELRSQLLNVLLAGRDTTASLIAWLFYQLARHPHVFEKLRRIVLEDFGMRPNLARITFSSLKSCTYLQHCVNETLRLCPVVPFNLRQAVRDTTLPRGGGLDGQSPVFVRKGQKVEYSVYVMHRRKELWGEDAEEFRPERWETRRPGWEFLPFNGGPRICLGQQFALTEASYVAVRMIQRFDRIINRDTETIVRHGLTLTDCPADGVKALLHQDPEYIG